MNNSFYNTEILGQIVGIYGDPVNQNTDKEGIALATAFERFSIEAGLEPEFQKELLWSRILLCKILTKDNTAGIPKLALVLRPRSLWLFDNGSTQYKDFEKNICDTRENLPKKISQIYPKYKNGDIIEIGILPRYVSIFEWDDGFDYSSVDFNSQITCQDILFDGGGGLGFQSGYMNIVSLYDKNIQARSRLGNRVYVKICKEDGNDVYLPFLSTGEELTLAELPEGAEVIA